MAAASPGQTTSAVTDHGTEEYGHEATSRKNQNKSKQNKALEATQEIL